VPKAGGRNRGLAGGVTVVIECWGVKDTSTVQNQRCSCEGKALFRSVLICVLALLMIQFRASASPTSRRQVQARPETQQVEVLFLSSMDPYSPDVASMIEQAKAEILNGSDKPVRFSLDYLNYRLLLGDPSHDNATASYLLGKYRGKSFQLVIAIGEAASTAAEQIRAKLFPEGYLLFFVVNPKNEARWLVPKPNRAGAVRKANYLATLQLALRQNPGTTRVVVASGSSDPEQQEMAIAREQFESYDSILRFEYLTNLDLTELLHRLAGEEAGSVILFLDFEVDATGEQFDPARVLPSISKATNRPIYGTLSSFVGNGAVGGSVAELGDVGRTLGQVGARILKAGKAESVPVATGDFQHYMFDWRQLHRFSIAENELPPHSVVLNWEYSPWELYRSRVIVLSTSLLVETLLIVLLIGSVVRRRRAQEAASRSESEFADAQRLAQIGSWLWDAEKAVLTCSEELHKIVGLAREVPLPQIAEMSRLFTRESWERLIVAKERAWQSGAVEECEVEVVVPDGETKWILVRGEPQCDRYGRMTSVHGTAQDITDRKRSQVKLQGSEERLTAIVDSAMDAIIAVDDQQQILLFNASAERMLGCPASLAVGSSLSRFIPERFRADHVAHLRRFSDTGVTTRSMGTNGRLWALRTNGEEFPIEASISQVEDAGKKLFTVIIRDVTARHRAEEAASESEKRFRLIANTAPVMIWMSGPDKLCNYFNEPWVAFTGRSLEQELGNGWTDGVHPDDLRTCLDTYTQSFARRERFSMEYRLRRYDARYRWVLDIGVPRFNSDNSFAGYVGCCLDVSDMKEAKAILVEFSGRLIRAGEEERARIARELHDNINQRLALLASGLQELEKTASADADPSQRCGLQELWRLTNEIATEIQHMSHQLHPSKLHYLGLPSTVRELCREFSQQHKIEVECLVVGLPEDLDENVSLNLFRTVQESLRNAAKHSKARRVSVELTCESGAIRLRISDDGVGFDHEDKRVHHGLGLISMRERLRSIGGELSIWSKPSLGTLLKGTVPVATKRSASELTVADPDGTP